MNGNNCLHSSRLVFCVCNDTLVTGERSGFVIFKCFFCLVWNLPARSMSVLLCQPARKPMITSELGKLVRPPSLFHLCVLIWVVKLCETVTSCFCSPCCYLDHPSGEDNITTCAIKFIFYFKLKNKKTFKNYKTWSGLQASTLCERKQPANPATSSVINIKQRFSWINCSLPANNAQLFW